MGWAQGLQAGMQLGTLVREGMLQEALAEEAKKYKVEEIGPDQSKVSDIIAQRDEALKGLGQNASPEQIQSVQDVYTPQIAGIAREVGSVAPQYSYGGQTFTDRQAAEAAAAQGRTTGLADVYRSYGQVGKAEDLASRAQQMQLTGLQLGKAKREEETAVGTKNAEVALADLKASGQPITSQTLAELAKTHKGDYNALLQNEVAQLGYDEKSAALEMKTLKRDLSKAAVGGIPAMNKFLADKFDPDKTDAITPEIVQTKNGFTVMYGGRVLPEYGTHKSLTELVGTVHGQIDGDPLGTLKTLASIRASEASIVASNAAAGLSGERLTSLKEERLGRSKAADIATEFENLTDAEKAGPKGQGLIRQFNMANVKAGGQISLGAQARPGQTMTDVEKENLRAFRKWEEDDRNARLPQAEKDKKATSMGVYQFVNPTANTVQSGLGSNPYANTGAQQQQQQQEGIQTRAPKLNSMNTRLLGSAGAKGYNVELPDGTTRIMEKDELEDLGYRFRRPL